MRPRGSLGIATGLLFTSGPGSLPVLPTVNGLLRISSLKFTPKPSLIFAILLTPSGGEVGSSKMSGISGLLPLAYAPVHVPGHLHDLAAFHALLQSLSWDPGWSAGYDPACPSPRPVLRIQRFRRRGRGLVPHLLPSS